MLYYFSATGNSAWVARQLATLLGDEAVDILTCMKNGEEPPKLRAGQRLGLVFPVHAWRPAPIMLDFINKLTVPDDCHVFALCTMASFAGNCMPFLSKFLRLDSSYSIQMPENYILLSASESESDIANKIELARQQLPSIASAILAGKKEHKIKKGPFPSFFTTCIGGIFKHLSKDRGFHCTQSCNSCGLCAELCILNNIKMVDGNPQWQGNCMHCMACLQNCPQLAIEYKNKTRKRQRYTFPAKYK